MKLPKRPESQVIEAKFGDYSNSLRARAACGRNIISVVITRRQVGS
jgi:hypothetical protein